MISFTAALVNGIEKAPEKRDDNAARAAVHEIADFFADIVFIYRTNDVAARVHALFHADDHVAGNERLGLFLNGEIAALLHARAVDPLRAAADQHDVFVAFRGDQREARAFALDQAVHGDGGGIADHVDRRKKLVHFLADGAGAFFDHAEKQTERSYGVVGTFLIRAFPSKFSTRSVKVPPTSISIEFIRRPRAAGHEW